MTKKSEGISCPHCGHWWDPADSAKITVFRATAEPSETSPNPAVQAPPCQERIMGIEGKLPKKPHA